jgi:uncharacterized repeat protein (TIGR03847 family)
MTADLGRARAVDALTFGEPGQRTFQLRVIGGGNVAASLWMEKQHLQQLNLAFAQVLAQIDYRDRPQPGDLSDFPVAAEHDFKVGRLALGFDPSDRTVVLDAYELTADLTADEEAEALLRVRLTPDQLAWLVGQLSEIIAKGRPLCPLCGVSADSSGHTCVRTNGHIQQAIPDERADEGEDLGP